MWDKIALGDKNKKKQFYNSRAPICLKDTKRIGQLEVVVIVLRRVLLFKFWKLRQSKINTLLVIKFYFLDAKKT